MHKRPLRLRSNASWMSLKGQEYIQVLEGADAGLLMVGMRCTCVLGLLGKTERLQGRM